MVKDVKQIYIAHPYGGVPELFEDNATIVQWLKEKYPQYNFMSPLEIFDGLYHKMTYYDGLEKCFALLDACDAVIFCESKNNIMDITADWKDSKGCNAEYGFAKGNSKPIYFLHTVIEKGKPIQFTFKSDELSCGDLFDKCCKSNNITFHFGEE